MKDNGGPAFPCAVGDPAHGVKGMLLRDWFAGMAMQGLFGRGGSRNPTELALAAYTVADNMIAVRGKSAGD